MVVLVYCVAGECVKGIYLCCHHELPELPSNAIRQCWLEHVIGCWTQVQKVYGSIPSTGHVYKCQANLFQTALVHPAVMGTWYADPRLDQLLQAALVPTLSGKNSLLHMNIHPCLDYKQLPLPLPVPLGSQYRNVPLVDIPTY